MKNKTHKKNIINNLNVILNDKKELILLCNELKNDIDKIIQYINKIIKYALINKEINQSLWTLIYELDDIEEKYKKYLEKNSKLRFLSILRKTPSIDNNLLTILDDTIDLTSVEGLILPSIETLKNICQNNIISKKTQEEKTRKKNNYYKEKRVFDEIGLTYTKTELITIDKSFIYYSPNLSGDISKDYNMLYNDERYNKNENNPLKNTYEKNVAQIRKKSDIYLKKVGNVYEIYNGRHRIIYLLKHGKQVTIPAQVKRRIEDREFNIILNELQTYFKLKIYKNNILNDEPNIFIILDDIIYEIKNKTELKDFYHNLQNKQSNIKYMKTTFKTIEIQTKEKSMTTYKQIIFNKYLELGEIILTSNFTDIMKYFTNSNNSLFYDAFNIIQQEYQESIIFNYDFKTMYLALNTYNTEHNDNHKKRK